MLFSKSLENVEMHPNIFFRAPLLVIIAVLVVVVVVVRG